jgi:sulfate adenylyltransferase subunit 2
MSSAVVDPISTASQPKPLTHLRALEAESIHIIREVAAEFSKPVMLYSIGKDSSVMLRLAQKAFYPGPIPFPLMHVDTRYKFREMIEFRDTYPKSLGAELLVKADDQAIADGINPFRVGTQKCCSILKTRNLLDGLAAHGFDAAFGGARRDEEKSRAKERIYSFRDGFGQWDPKNQRPELWNLYNARIDKGETIRVFPLSNWTELDVWQYILREQLEIPSIYFTHRREIVNRKGMLLAKSDYITLLDDEKYEPMQIRFRTVGDMTCTGAVVSEASCVEDIIREVASARVTERGGRSDDRRSDAAMEDRKAQGYF